MSFGDRDFAFALVLGGGNALGAFQAGVFQALHERDLVPDWVIGTSIGAINGAVIAGTPPDGQVTALERLWRPDASSRTEAMVPFGWAEDARRTAAVHWTMLGGRPGLFGPPLSSSGLWTEAGVPAVFETSPLAGTLDRLVDFDRLNAGPCRYTAVAVDLESGDDVIFDSRRCRIVPDHMRASAAFPIAFPAVEIDGRWLVDGGVSHNLPIDPFFADPPARPSLCLAVDLLHLQAPRPRTLGEVASRAQDLMFAAQSRRAIARWQALDAAAGDAERPSIAFVRLAYTDQEQEVAGKAMDYSGGSVRQRWDSGYARGRDVLAAIDGGALDIGAAGLNVHRV